MISYLFSFQIHLVHDSFGYIYDNVTVGTGGSVLRDIFFDDEEELLTIGISSDSELQPSQVRMNYGTSFILFLGSNQWNI